MELTPQLVPVLDTEGKVVDLILDSTFLAACREREDRYNEKEGHAGLPKGFLTAICEREKED
jgi:hypothetical protein